MSLMPSAKRKPAPTPPSKSKYMNEVHDNAAPFTPAPLDFIDPVRTVKGGGVDGVPNVQSGADAEAGTGKCGEM